MTAGRLLFKTPQIRTAASWARIFSFGLVATARRKGEPGHEFRKQKPHHISVAGLLIVIRGGNHLTQSSRAYDAEMPCHFQVAGYLV